MPALKMKIKSKTNFLREYKRKSTKISKGSRPQIKLSDKQSTVDSSDLSSWKVPCKNEESTQTVDIFTESNDCHDMYAGDSTQLLKLLFSSHDSASFGGIEFMMASSIFSPGFEQEDEQFRAIIPNYTDGVEHPQLPNLVIDEVDDKSFVLNESLSCSAADLNLFLSGFCTELPVDESIGFNDTMNVTCPDFEAVNWNALFDMHERPIIFPLLDESLESKHSNDDKSVVEHMVDSNDSCLYLAINQLKLPDQGAHIKFSCGAIEETPCINLQLAGNKLSDSLVSSSNPPLLRQEKGKPNTLVLDLDETLVHSKLEHCDDADFNFPVFFNMKQHTVYVRRRPYLQTFLERVAQMFRVVIFTASQSIYAESLVNILDPERKLISQCFYRESCIFSDGSYTKDLTILGVDLANVVIIDNSPQVFRLQVDNGIPIKSWFDDPTDQALNSLLPFLENLACADDVRPLISRTFGNADSQIVSVH